MPEPDDLVVSHLHLVQHVVHQVAARYPRHVDRDELWNAGALGLVDASRRYDPTTGTPFARYAAIRIRGAIIDSTRRRDFSTRSLRRNARRVRAAAEDLRGRLDREPTVEELAAELGTSTEELADLQARVAAASVLRLDQHLASSDDEDGLTLADTLEERTRDLLPQEEVEHRELVGSLLAAIEQLGAPRDEVVRRYYLEGHLLRDIADDLGVTEARVSQLRSEAVIALRAYFEGEYGGVDEPVDDHAPGGRHRAAFLARVAERGTWRARLDAADRYTQRQQPARLVS